jgi:aspartyl-tRNA(Asn)/glutamyl-tRNA(Gln) amidotransferase subunit B
MVPMSSYKTTVGIEVHAELKTKSKMFCGCKNDPHAAEPNSNICPVCMAHPGTLPTVNKEAVRFLMMVGKAIGGELAEYSEFDRKNYFYPDIPKAYQISQYQFPFVKGGEIAGVKVTRVHLEEDTARSVHDQGEESLVDFNRAGVPLMELVTEPVIHDAESAGKFARELQLLLRTLGVSDANMEKGEMRVEANISVSTTPELGVKVEVKNLNSFKSVEGAIDYETKRHIEEIEAGRSIKQETRGWDESKSRTFLQRSKETAQDYRYFPDPDIPKFQRSLIEEFSDSRISENLPETPELKRHRYAKSGLPEKQIEVIISEVARASFFDSVLSQVSNGKSVLLAGNYFTTDVLSLLENVEYNIGSADAVCFVKLIELLESGEINSRVAKDILTEVVFGKQDPRLLAESRGLIQENSEDAVLLIVKTVIEENPGVAAEYRAGKEASIQFLVGQGMKKSKGSANPGILKDLLEKELKQ